MPREKYQYVVPPELNRKRLDQVLSELCPEHSRSRLQNWIRSGYVTVDERALRQKDQVFTDQLIAIDAEVDEQEDWEKQAIPLDIVFEDEEILIINKPAGLVVHPGAGNPDNTLLNALLYHAECLSMVPRAGIVQRLDKDTSGLMVVAKSLTAHTYLVEELQQRNIKRQYEAVVYGVMTAGGSVDAPIGRHPRQRKRMAVNENGKQATTHYRILKKYPAHTYVKLQLESGRTHQIRVHMLHINYPIVGDPVYTARRRSVKNCSVELRETLQQFLRQALHACQLDFIHPVSDQALSFSAPLPEDIQHLLRALDNDASR